MTSGNFDTAAQEVKLVEYWLEKYSPYTDCSVVKYTGNRSDADILVSVGNTNGAHVKFTVEVKEEQPWRWTKYHQLGIDYYSAFQYLPQAGEASDTNSLAHRFQTGVHRGTAFLDSLNSYISVNKEGKVFYSKADVWLFVGHKDKNYTNSDYFAYFGSDIVNDTFRSYIENNCSFTINDKPETQDSRNDDWHSMVFFVNLNDMPATIEWTELEHKCKQNY